MGFSSTEGSKAKRGLFKTAELELTEEVLRGADMDTSKGRDGLREGKDGGAQSWLYRGILSIAISIIYG